MFGGDTQEWWLRTAGSSRGRGKPGVPLSVNRDRRLDGGRIGRVVHAMNVKSVTAVMRDRLLRFSELFLRRGAARECLPQFFKFCAHERIQVLCKLRRQLQNANQFLNVCEISEAPRIRHTGGELNVDQRRQ